MWRSTLIQSASWSFLSGAILESADGTRPKQSVNVTPKLMLMILILLMISVARLDHKQERSIRLVRWNAISERVVKKCVPPSGTPYLRLSNKKSRGGQEVGGSEAIGQCRL